MATWLVTAGLVPLVGTGSVEVTWFVIGVMCVTALASLVFAIRSRNVLLVLLAGLLLVASAPVIVGISYWQGAP